MTWDGRRVIVGVGGGIACYKACDLVSKLAQAGAEVTVAMTPAATRFVTPLTFEALSGRAALVDIWQQATPGDTQHVTLTAEADLFVVAPATMNLLAKAAGGFCDDIVSLLLSTSTCPVLWCPGMNSRMWQNPATQANLQTLTSRGHHTVGPDTGWLACRDIGPGRMSDTADILAAGEPLLTD